MGTARDYFALIQAWKTRPMAKGILERISEGVRRMIVFGLFISALFEVEVSLKSGSDSSMILISMGYIYSEKTTIVFLEDTFLVKKETIEIISFEVEVILDPENQPNAVALPLPGVQIRDVQFELSEPSKEVA